jgi:flagellar motor switch protein FliM
MRDFSEIEKILLERVVAHMLGPLPEAWENVKEIRPVLSQVETNPQFAQIIAPSETTALVTLSIRVGAVEGLMNFCLPIPVIEPVLDRLYTRYWFVQARDIEGIDYTDDLQHKIETADVRISAVVGKTSLMVSEFVNISIGDVIMLDSFPDSDFEVYVGPLRKFYAKPGISRGRNAIQITKLIQREE